MSAAEQRAGCPPPVGMESRDGGDPVVETSCVYWPTGLTAARAEALGQLHGDHPVETCMVQLALMAKVFEPLDSSTVVGQSRWLWAESWDWPELLAAGESPVRRVTVQPVDDEELAELRAARAAMHRVARGGDW